MIKEGEGLLWVQNGSQGCDINERKLKDSMSDRWHERKYGKGRTKSNRKENCYRDDARRANVQCSEFAGWDSSSQDKKELTD